MLASASPRRSELLRNAGIPFVVQVADIDETLLRGESPHDCAVRLARGKALGVAQSRPADCILGADTIVVVDGTTLGKPNDAVDAVRMLRMLAGRVHEVITGVCVVEPVASGQLPVASKTGRAVVSGQLAIASKTKTQFPPLPGSVTERLETGNRQVATAFETTLVTMIELSDEEIRAYVASGEPMDKAGAYAIQGRASRWIPRIEGDYHNVVGLPVALVYRMLREMRVLEGK